MRVLHNRSERSTRSTRKNTRGTRKTADLNLSCASCASCVPFPESSHSWLMRLRAAFSAAGSDSFDLFHNAQDVSAENLLDVLFGIALLQQRVGDLGQLRHVFHPERHHGTVKVG